MPALLVLAACGAEVAQQRNTGPFTVVVASPSVATTLIVPDNALGVSEADLVLPSEMFGEKWTGFHVQHDIGEDGADDVVSFLAEVRDKYYGDSVHSAFGVWPDVLDAASMWTVTSPAFVDDGYSRQMGVTSLWPTVDVTNDGAPDLWVLDRLEMTTLLPGPLDQAVLDPAALGVSTFVGFGIPASTDLDGDGVGELLVDIFVPGYAVSEGVTRCEGPFVGLLDLGDCPMAVHPDAQELHALADGDVDGDGIDDLLLEAMVSSDTPDPGWNNEVVLILYDGAFVDGEAEPLLTLHPSQSRDFYYADDTRLALDDLDGDGLSDLTWVEEPDFYYSGEGEIAVMHAPPTDGSDVDLDDATLNLTGIASDAQISGVAPRPTGGAWLVLQPWWLVPTAEAFTPMLVDGAMTGTVDPIDTAWFLAADGVAPISGWVHVESHVGDFDGDSLGDVLVVDGGNAAGWVYLGASLP